MATFLEQEDADNLLCPPFRDGHPITFYLLKSYEIYLYKIADILDKF